MKTGFALATAIPVLAAGALSMSARRHRAALARDAARMLQTGDELRLPPIDWRTVDGLPVPVQRYLRLALGRSERPIRSALLQQAGRLRTDGRSPSWMRFTAVQTVVPAAAAFLWNARVTLWGPAVLRVVDRLQDVQGAGQVLALSAIRVGTSVGGREMNEGALHRFLAEAVWCPTALLPGECLRWTPIDELRALATLSVSGTSVSLEFRFNEAGEVAGIYTPARWGRFGTSSGARFEQRGWEGRFRDYVDVQGLRVPSRGEVGWYAPGPDAHWDAVWQGTLTHLDYRF